MNAFIVILILAMLAFLVGYLYGYSKEKKSAMTEETRICQTSNNTAMAAKEIGAFLHRRGWVCRLYDSRYDGKKYEGIPHPNAYYKGYACSIIYLIRLCHLLGCKIIVRQIGSGEGENEEQIVSSMRASFRRRSIKQIFNV